MFKRTILTIALVLLLIFNLSCQQTGAYFGSIIPPAEPILRYLNSDEPRSLDPHRCDTTVEQNIIINLYESLTVYDPQTLAPLPGVAERWESFDETRRWVFHLRRNARWTDGQPVTAHDFVWAWQRAVTPASAALYVSLMYYVKNAQKIADGKLPPTDLGVRAIDDYTLEVLMEQPTAFFAKMTPHYVFAPLPRWAIEKWGDKWTRPEHHVANGPFKLNEHEPYDQVVIVKNPDYWDSDKVQLEKVYFYPEHGAAAINLYKAGEADIMSSGMIPLPLLKALRVKKDYVVGPFLATQYYALNIKRKPLDNVLVRRALNMAIDKSAITDKLIGKGDVPATAFVPPGLAGYPQHQGPQYSPEQARKLLAEAGYANGQNFPTITISINTNESIKQIAETIQQMWKKELNINAEIQNEEWQTLQARGDRREFDIFRTSWNGDYLDANTFLEMFATDTTNNRPGWLNPEFTQLVTQANGEPDEAKRIALLSKAEAILIDEMAVIPLYYGALSYMQKPFVEGYYANLFDVHPLKSVSVRKR